MSNWNKWGPKIKILKTCPFEKCLIEEDMFPSRKMSTRFKVLEISKMAYLKRKHIVRRLIEMQRTKEGRMWSGTTAAAANETKAWVCLFVCLFVRTRTQQPLTQPPLRCFTKYTAPAAGLSCNYPNPLTASLSHTMQTLLLGRRYSLTRFSEKCGRVCDLDS